MTRPAALQELREKLIIAQQEALAHAALWTRDRVRALPMEHWGEAITIGEFIDRWPRRKKQYMGDWTRAVALPLAEHGVIWGTIEDDPETGSHVVDYDEHAYYMVWQRIR